MERTSKKLSNMDVRDFRTRLEAERQDTLRSLAQFDHERRIVANDGPQDAGDLCVASLARESLFERSSQKRRQLTRIEIALRRIERGQFGVCIECGEPINRKRLEAMPWTQHCLECQEEVEREQNRHTVAAGEAFG